MTTHTLREIVDQGWRVCDASDAERPAEQATFNAMLGQWRCDVLAAQSGTTEAQLVDETRIDMIDLTGGDESLVPPAEEMPARRSADGALLPPIDLREFVGRIFYDHPVQVAAG